MAEDILLIWDAKMSGFDMGSVVDVQFLCGAGLDATKRFLASQRDERALEALHYISECEEAGDFDGFSPEEHLQGNREYSASETQRTILRTRLFSESEM